MTAGRALAVALAAGFLACLAPQRGAAASVAATLPAGARVGIVNLLDAEVTYFHSARRVQDSFLKTYPVPWPVAGMLTEALRARLTQSGFVAVPVAASESLARARESCFLNANLTKPLSRECAAPYAQLAASEQVVALIVLGPGLNDSTHAQSTRRKELPEYLRGWCVVSGEGAALPTLLNLTELILVVVTPKGPVLGAREWGGRFTQPWSAYAPAADPKVLSEAQLAQLSPLFATLLQQQAAALVDTVGTTH